MPNGHFEHLTDPQFTTVVTEPVTDPVTKQKATRLGGFRFAANPLI
jgi:hypothetical protein